MKMESIGKGLVFLAWLGLTCPAAAQTIEISPTYGYQFGAKLEYRLGYLKLKDSDQIGFTVGYATSDRTRIEFTYSNMGNELRIRDSGLGPSEVRLSDMSVNIFQIGGTRYLTDGKVQPYTGGRLGLAVFRPGNENRDIIDFDLGTTSRFALSFKAGVLLNVSDRIGVKFQGDFFMPVDWGGIYIGAGGSGPSGGVSLGGTTLVAGVSGGIVLRP